MKEAFDALDAHDIDGALKLGRRLKKLRHSSAFEVLAAAHAARGKLDEAIAVLEEGVAVVPSVWVLWQLLGNFYSDRERFADSLRCYRRALECPNVNAEAIHLNASIALGRDGRYDEALAEVEQVKTPEMVPHAGPQRMYLLNRVERFAECVTLGEHLLSSGRWTGDLDEPLAAVHAELSAALWASKHDRDAVLRHAWKAIELHKRQRTAARVIRDVGNARSPLSRHLTVTVRGRWSQPFEGETEPPGFLAIYEVVAETAEEALAFIRPFEPEGVRDTLVVDACTEREAEPDQPKGVCEARGGHLFFPWEDEESEKTAKPWWKFW